jgi:hypothetical protein
MLSYRHLSKLNFIDNASVRLPLLASDELRIMFNFVGAHLVDDGLDVVLEESLEG